MLTCEAKMPQMEESEKTILDESLLKIGMSEKCLVQHQQFYRSDDPPENVIIQTNRIVEPKMTHFPDKTAFPFKIENELTFVQKEHYELQQIHLQKLIDSYQNQLDNLDLITEANKTALSESDLSVKRRHFYYCYLSSILNSPVKAGIAKINQLISLQKLFVNQTLKTKPVSNVIDKCCSEPDCPQIAIQGSKYCGWHILKESGQRLYEKCPECGWPRIVNEFQPCKGHKDKGRQQKRTVHHNSTS